MDRWLQDNHEHVATAITLFRAGLVDAVNRARPSAVITLDLRDLDDELSRFIYHHSSLRRGPAGRWGT